MTRFDSLLRPLAERRLRAALVGMAETAGSPRPSLPRFCRLCGAFDALDAAALDSLRRLQPDVALLRVALRAETGLWEEAARSVGALVLLADGPELAVRAFQVGAVDYLVAPFGEPRLRQALERAAERARQAPVVAPAAGYLQRFAVRGGRYLYLLDAGEVQWISSAGNYVEFHTGRECHRVRGSLTELEHRLDPGRFLRIHRRHIVQIASVRRLFHVGRGEYELTLQHGKTLKLTRKYRRCLEALRTAAPRAALPGLAHDLLPAGPVAAPATASGSG